MPGKAANYQCLKELGLSKTAVACYESLDLQGAANVSQLAQRLQKPRTGLYRVLKRLEKMGFVRGIKTTAQPVYFHAVHLDKALGMFALYQQKAVKRLIKMQRQRFERIRLADFAER